MGSKAGKKEQIRKQIIAAAHAYRDNLAGKVFLYVTGAEYFEVVFQTDRFMHLTGVNSTQSAKDFYRKAKASKLTTDQILFDAKHSYPGAKKKLPCLLQLPLLTNSLVCVVKDMKTKTLTYRVGVTNLSFTLGLTENIDAQGNKINEWYSPRTLRVKDKAVENSSDAEFVDYIFSKDASKPKYDALCFADKEKHLPDTVKALIAEPLMSQFTSK